MLLCVQGTLSLNAAIFAAVLLASRLESNEKVFGLVLFALELFAFFPLARCGLRSAPARRYGYPRKAIGLQRPSRHQNLNTRVVRRGSRAIVLRARRGGPS